MIENGMEYVIYGASGGGRKVFFTLKNTGIDIDFFVDGDSSKWGSKFEGKDVKSPEEIDKNKHLIIIASELSQEVIEEKLTGLGLYSNIIMKEEILLKHLHKVEKAYLLEEKEVTVHNEKSVFIELLEGTPKGAGGMVSWSMNVASIFMENDIYARILSTGKFQFPEGKEKLFQKVETSYGTYWEDVIKLAQVMERKLPCVIILNKQMQMLYAAILLKRKYPEYVKIVSVVHSDAICLYKRSNIIEKYIDIFIGITEYIKNRLIQSNISKEKIVYKEMPIFDCFMKKRTYSENKNKIKIGYAGRLEIMQKRADLLIELIKQLELKKITYEFHIAGTGTYYNEIRNYINKNKLGQNIILYNQLPREKMPLFWHDKDIFIAVSDREGCCLSMMEAMASGAVPVVTNFSVSNEYVSVPKNGYVVPFGDMKMMAGRIEELYRNPYIIKEKSIACMKYVKTHCSYNSYKEFLLNLINKK
ncbi:MAG: glycosyltransferase family 4 protein [Lachnospiraceae bacterium]|nr:glycosyltransferase family 4 protein [Lachnospiraceae bacterium]